MGVIQMGPKTQNGGFHEKSPNDFGHISVYGDVFPK
jgi:hypothetical protein